MTLTAAAPGGARPAIQPTREKICLAATFGGFAILVGIVSLQVLQKQQNDKHHLDAVRSLVNKGLCDQALETAKIIAPFINPHLSNLREEAMRFIGKNSACEVSIRKQALNEAETFTTRKDIAALIFSTLYYSEIGSRNCPKAWEFRNQHLKYMSQEESQELLKENCDKTPQSQRNSNAVDEAPSNTPDKTTTFTFHVT